MQDDLQIPPPKELSSAFLETASEHWYACGALPPTKQGWKLYVSATILNFRRILFAVAGALEARGVHFKYVRDLLLLRKLNAGAFGYPQIGKCLVVYMPVPDADLIAELKAALAPFRRTCPTVPFACPFGDGLPFYYRYGAYADEIITVGGQARRDDRSEAPVPEGVDDALAPFARPEPVDPRIRSFLLRYPVIDAIVQQGKSGIFRALNLGSESLQEVILKVGYPNGQVQIGGDDGVGFIRRELRFYREIAERGGSRDVPKLVEAFDEDRSAMIVLEKIEGESLLRRHLAGGLRTSDLDECHRIITELHRRGLYLGDAKLANFLGDADNRVVVIDFEGAGVLGRDQMRAIRTFDLHNPYIEEPSCFDRLHFLASVLFPYVEGRYEPDDRKVDLRDYAARTPNDDNERWAVERLRAELAMLGASAA